MASSAEKRNAKSKQLDMLSLPRARVTRSVRWRVSFLHTINVVEKLPVTNPRHASQDLTMLYNPSSLFTSGFVKLKTDVSKPGSVQ